MKTRLVPKKCQAKYDYADVIQIRPLKRTIFVVTGESASYQVSPSFEMWVLRIGAAFRCIFAANANEERVLAGLGVT